MSSKTQNASKASATMVEDALTASRDGVDALRQASAVYLDGFEQISASYLAYVKSAADLGTEAAKAVLSAKTVQDVVDVQTDYAKQRFDNFAAEGTKISEISTKAATEVMAPVRKRFDETVAKVVEAATV